MKINNIMNVVIIGLFSHLPAFGKTSINTIQLDSTSISQNATQITELYRSSNETVSLSILGEELLKATNTINILSICCFVMLLLVFLSFLFLLFRFYKDIKTQSFNQPELDSLFSSVDEMLKHKLHKIDSNISNLQNTLIDRERYFNKTIDYIYQTIYSIVNQLGNDDVSRIILTNFFHEFQIAKLYHTSFDSNEEQSIQYDKFSAFAYLEENGSLEDIPHLEYVAQHDINIDNRNRAIEIIGHIRERENKNE